MENDFEHAHTGEAIRDAGLGAKEEAHRLGDAAKDRGVAALHDQRARASNEIRGVAKAIRAGADCFDEQGQDTFATYSRKAADRVERISGTIEQGDVREVMQGAERFVREHPALIIGGTCLLGFAAVRFLKASEERREQAEVEVEPSRHTSPTMRSDDIYEH